MDESNHCSESLTNLSFINDENNVVFPIKTQEHVDDFTCKKDTKDKNIIFIYLLDDVDRLGSNLCRYICTILVAIKHNYKIQLLKPKIEYKYYNSIFVESLFTFIEEYNEKNFENIIGVENDLIKYGNDFFQRMLRGVMSIKNDFVTAFKQDVFTKGFKDNFNEIAKAKNYIIPYNVDKTIVVHLRLDDKTNIFVDYNDRMDCSSKFKNIIDDDNLHYTHPGYIGQAAINENEISVIINRALNIYKDHEVIIITNSHHTLPYKTITTNDESYDLFLLCNSKVLIGSMSTYSFTAMFFGDHEKIYYPLWDHAVLFGLTTKYNKTNNIEFF